jgi:hypothetical protein
MVTASRNAKSDFEIAPAGNHLANCIKVIDLGTQPGSDQFPKPKRKVKISWELCDETVAETGKPFIINQKYTLSLHENAALCKHLESWRGRPFTDAEADGFDIAKLLGQPCLLNVVHTRSGDNTYANVAAISPVPKGLPRKEPVNPLVHFDLDNFDGVIFDDLSEFDQKAIQGSPEYKDLFEGTAKYSVAELDDEIPF